LWLYSNELSGSIPVVLSNLSNLETLYLNNNQLTGTIPTELSSLSSLTRLYLGNNQLNGSIPSILNNFPLLERLDLQNNQLTGAIPTEINNLSNLSFCYINGNSFSELPLLTSTSIQYLYTHENKFTFGDLESTGLNFSALADVTYSPQLKADAPTKTDNGNNTTTLTVADDATGNTYQWYKNGAIFDGETTNTLTVDNTAESYYYCVISNANYPDLVLETEYALFNMTVSHGIDEEEYNALVALYNSTNGDSWTDNTNWLSEESINEWFGVTITEAHVTEIHLPGNNLTGSIPSELGALNYIEALYLDQNQITGEIPSELGNLTNIAELSLWVNQLTGSIPPELGNLTHLSYLDFDENQLSGTIPAELGNLTNLTNLWLDANQLSGNIPVELGNLVNLEKLGLAMNYLSGTIPTELGNLLNLDLLLLYDNLLTGEIPTELGNLSNMVSLYLFTNQLTGTIPTELGSLNNLTTLWLHSNELSGSIPSELGNLSNLETLYLHNNQLIGTVPSELGSLSNLTRLYLGNNQLSGSVPSTLGSLSLLERLDLQNNQLTGAIPVEINNLSNLTFGYFNGNSFNELSLLTSTNIQYLYTQENDFTFADLETSGLDFSTLAEVTYSPQAKLAEPTKTDNGNNTTTLSFTTDGTGNIYQWYKNGEELTGETTNTITIDNTAESFYYCTVSNANYPELILETEYAEFNMTASHGIDEDEYNALVAFYNSTDGDNWTDNTNWNSDENVQNWFGLTILDGHVTVINLAGNNLTGNIPGEIGSLNSLLSLNIDHNEITGEIPSEIGNLSNLTELNLWVNKLSGNIPAELGNLTNLTVMDIGYNQLAGSLPSTLGDLTNLEHIWLNDNQLSGEIPVELGNLSNLQMLGFSSNQLTGSIPAELGSLNNLTYLSLFSNSVTGTIPTELGSMSNLSYLYLHENKLTGSIPAEIGNLSNLEYLNLYSNQLTGSIPAEIGNCSILKTLTLSSNQLSGSIPVEIGNLSLLTNLSARNNLLSGTLPAQIGNLTNLETLSIRYNNLEGLIPTELSNLVNLQSVYLSNNNFTSGADLSALTSLATLFVSNNEFTFGDVENFNIDFSNPSYNYAPQAQLPPPSQTPSGDDIILSFTTDGTGNTYQWYKDDEIIIGETNNTLTIANAESGIFHCIIENSNYPSLTLSTTAAFINNTSTNGVTEEEYNALVEFYNSTNGDYWKNNTNWLTAEDVCNWYGVTVEAGHVTKIELLYNGLTGSIPSSIDVLSSLEKIEILETGEGLTGTIPEEIGNLNTLTYLSIFNNSLGGEIPASIGNLSNLEYLNLNFNNLTGEIPVEIGGLTNLSTLSLNNNKLQGDIPAEIGYLSNLENLYLQSNELTGNVSENFSNLTKLVFMEINDNKLSGLTDLSSLTNLFYLYLDNNSFTFKDFDDTKLDFSSLSVADYTPQENLVMANNYMYFSEGKNVTLSCDNLTTEELSGTNNQYAIYKDGALIRSWSSDPNYLIPYFTSSNAGEYAIQVKSTEFVDLILYSDTMTIGINNAPTNIDITNNSIDENSIIGSIIGELSTSDLDAGDSFTYSFITGDGTNDAGNSSFTIEDNNLKTAVDLDYETKDEYYIYVKTKDTDGLTYAKAFVINVSNNNEAPTNIELSENSIDENSNVGSIIGQLSTTDIDNGDTFTYNFVSGDGNNDADNASFTIEGNSLKTAIEVDYETKNEYKIYIQTKDTGGLSFEKAFTININDVDETTGVNDLNALKQSIYPNPSNGSFVVECNSLDYEIKIFDVTGSVIYNQKSNSFKHEINLNAISSGTYFVTIIDNGIIKTQKLMIQ